MNKLDKEQQKELVSKLLQASETINRTPKADYIHLNESYIQSMADENGVSFDEMVNIIKEELR
jgi:hypothetical protein